MNCKKCGKKISHSAKTGFCLQHKNNSGEDIANIQITSKIIKNWLKGEYKK